MKITTAGHSRKILASSALALTLALGGMAASTIDAHAAPGSYCPKGSTCLWRDNYFKSGGSTEGRISFPETVNNFDPIGLRYYNGFRYNSYFLSDNSASSVWNNGNWATVYLYDLRNREMSGYSGRSGPLAMRAGTWKNILPWPWYDVISSASF